MQSKKEILGQLADVKEREQFLPEDLGFIFSCLENEEDYIRAAAVLSLEKALYKSEVIDRLVDCFEYENNLNVKKAIVKELGNFVTSAYLEGFDTDEQDSSYDEDYSDFSEQLENNLKEQFFIVKNLLFQYLNEIDIFEPLFINILAALFVFGDKVEIQQKVLDVWDVEDEEKSLILFPIIDFYPRNYEKQILEILTDSSSETLIIKTIEISYKIGSKQVVENIANLLEHQSEKVICASLIALANINLTKNLQDLLQKFCLHTNATIKNSAKKALEIYSVKNFNDFMGDYYNQEQ